MNEFCMVYTLRVKYWIINKSNKNDFVNLNIRTQKIFDTGFFSLAFDYHTIIRIFTDITFIWKHRRNPSLFFCSQSRYLFIIVRNRCIYLFIARNRGIYLLLFAIEIFIYFLFSKEVFIYILFAIEIFIYFLIAIDVFIYILFAIEVFTYLFLFAIEVFIYILFEIVLPVFIYLLFAIEVFIYFLFAIEVFIQINRVIWPFQIHFRSQLSKIYIELSYISYKSDVLLYESV